MSSYNFIFSSHLILENFFSTSYKLKIIFVSKFIEGKH